MSDYIKRTWKDGEVITAEKLNNLETGVAEAKKEAEQSGLPAAEALKVANEAKTDAANAASAASAAQATADSKAPPHILSATDIDAGSTALASGQLYLVYE